MSGKCFSDNSYLSAILDRQGLLVAAPIDVRTKKADNLTPQLLQGFWNKLKKKTQERRDVPDCCYEELQATKSFWATIYLLCLVVADHQILGGKYFLILGPETGRIWWLKKVQCLQQKAPLPMDLPAWKKKLQVDVSQPWQSVTAVRINQSLA